METKRCCICDEEKPIIEFGQNKRKKDGKQGYCIQCSKEKDKKHYATNPNRRKKIRDRDNRATAELKDYVCFYLLNHPCIGCGEQNIVVLDFDHRNGKEKEHNIARMLQLGGSLEILKKEIQKCDVRCANCHRIKTAKERNIWKLSFWKKKQLTLVGN